MILHIPHSSIKLPDDFKVSGQTDLKLELERMTDWFTDELFSTPDATQIVFPLSRLYCDVERFRDDKDESMAKKGMGVCYATNSFGAKLRDISDQDKENIKSNFYDKHHKLFADAVNQELQGNDKAIIVDCHSFSNKQLPHEDNSERPDFCIGTDPYHTPQIITYKLKDLLESHGYTVAINNPFSGTMVPLEHYGKNKNVISVMIEINRKLYLNADFTKSNNFTKTKETISQLLNLINS